MKLNANDFRKTADEISDYLEKHSSYLDRMVEIGRPDLCPCPYVCYCKDFNVVFDGTLEGFVKEYENLKSLNKNNK